MASLQQGEKQLFEKFWKGTFKAVATPRPESIIVASITARKPMPRCCQGVGFGKKVHQNRKGSNGPGTVCSLVRLKPASRVSSPGESELTGK